MRNAAKDSIGEYFVAIRIIGEELCSIVKAHFIHFINPGGSAVKRILFSKQLFLNEAHCTAAQNDHYVAVAKFRIPQILQHRRYARISFTHIREFINNE